MQKVSLTSTQFASVLRENCRDQAVSQSQDPEVKLPKKQQQQKHTFLGTFPKLRIQISLHIWGETSKTDMIRIKIIINLM